MSVDSKSKLISAILGVVGGSAAAAVIGYFSSSTIEREKFDYALVQQALEADTPEERQQRLRFIINMGFISNPEWTENLSQKLKDKPEEIPQLPKSSPSSQAAQQSATAPFSPNLISDFFSKKYETRSKAYSDIVSNHANNPSVLITLLSSAPSHFEDGDAIVNTLTITKFFSDAAILQSKLSVKQFLEEINSLIARNPDQWKQTKNYSIELKQRVDELEAK